MDLKQIEYFLELAKQEHVSITADFLGISQPALSKSIASLEKELGVKLFDRQGNRIKLNESGRQFAESAQKSMLQLHHGILMVKQSRYDVKGTVHIACHIFADTITKCALKYRELNPESLIVLEQGPFSSEAKCYSEEVDFVLSAENEFQDAFQQKCTWIAQPLVREQFYILISPRYRVYPETITSLSVAELKDDHFVTIPREDLFFSDITYRVCQSAGFSPRESYQTNDFLVKIRTVGEGKAIALVPECCIDMAQRLFPDLRQFKIEDYNTERTIVLMRRKMFTMSEVALDFWNFALDYFQVEPCLQGEIS